MPFSKPVLPSLSLLIKAENMSSCSNPGADLTSSSLRISRQCFLLRACALQRTLSGLISNSRFMINLFGVIARHGRYACRFQPASALSCELAIQTISYWHPWRDGSTFFLCIFLLADRVCRLTHRWLRTYLLRWHRRKADHH